MNKSGTELHAQVKQARELYERQKMKVDSLRKDIYGKYEVSSDQQLHDEIKDLKKSINKITLQLQELMDEIRSKFS